MGANPTQARGVLVFLVAFVWLAAALATGGNSVLFLASLSCLAVSLVLFLKCKPWEQNEE